MIILSSFPSSSSSSLDFTRLEELIRETKISGLRWSEKFTPEEVAFGVKKLRVACVIDDKNLSTQEVIDTLTALHDYGHKEGKDHHHEGHHGHHGHSAVEAKKMIQSVEFVAFTK